MTLTPQAAGQLRPRGSPPTGDRDTENHCSGRIFTSEWLLAEAVFFSQAPRPHWVGAASPMASSGQVICVALS